MILNPSLERRSENHGTKGNGKSKRKSKGKGKFKFKFIGKGKGKRRSSNKLNESRESVICAEAALAYYNRQNDTHYELMEVVTHCSEMLNPDLDGTSFLAIWNHLNFKAKLHPDSDTTPKLFFAELWLRRPYEYHATSCSIIDPDDPETAIGCVFCPPDSNAKHPARGFCTGPGPYCPYFTLGKGKKGQKKRGS